MEILAGISERCHHFGLAVAVRIAGRKRQPECIIVWEIAAANLRGTPFMLEDQGTVGILVLPNEPQKTGVLVRDMLNKIFPGKKVTWGILRAVR